VKFAQQVLMRDRQAMFNSWLTALIRDENVNFGTLRSHDQQQQPEAEDASDSGATPEQTQPPAQTPAKS
jgi:hypothetical protein